MAQQTITARLMNVEVVCKTLGHSISSNKPTSQDQSCHGSRTTMTTTSETRPRHGQPT